MRWSSRVPVLAGLLAFCSLTPRLAAADVPVCNGDVTPHAHAALEQGKAHYRRGRASASSEADEMRAAVASFDAACAGGDANALEFRAYALFALGRYVDAAESLDAFLADHALGSLPRDVQLRVSAQQPAIVAKVAMLNVSSDAATAQVVVAGRNLGAAPAQARVLAHTPVEIDVTAPGFEPMKRTVTLEAGAEGNEVFAMLPTRAALHIDAPDGADVSIDGVPVGRTPLAPIRHAAGPVDVTVSFGGEPHVHHLVLALGEDRTETFTFAAAAKPVDVVTAPPPATRGLRTWVYVSAGASLAMVAGGVGFAVWRNNRTSTYDASCLTKQVAGCSSTLDQFHIAEGGEIAAFALAGGLAATAAVLWVLDRKPATAPTPVSFTCAPGVAAFGCAGRF
jgi:hypothetical protein